MIEMEIPLRAEEDAQTTSQADRTIRARIRMSDAHGWLHCVRVLGDPRADHWCVVAVELDGDLKRPVGVTSRSQAPGRGHGLSVLARARLDDELQRRLRIAA